MRDPTEWGGAFLWARKVGIETIGFIAGCSFIGKEIVGLGVIALTFGLYLERFLPSLRRRPSLLRRRLPSRC